MHPVREVVITAPGLEIQLAGARQVGLPIFDMGVFLNKILAKFS
jgi:hypothetical protein